MDKSSKTLASAFTFTVTEALIRAVDRIANKVGSAYKTLTPPRAKYGIELDGQQQRQTGAFLTMVRLNHPSFSDDKSGVRQDRHGHGIELGKLAA